MIPFSVDAGCGPEGGFNKYTRDIKGREGTDRVVVKDVPYNLVKVAAQVDGQFESTQLRPGESIEVAGLIITNTTAN